MDTEKSEIDKKREALQHIIKEFGGCSCVDCDICPLKFYLKRSDNTWMSCSGVVETLFGDIGDPDSWVKTAAKVLSELEVEEMLRDNDVP